jgi:hypothetical protein
MAVTLKELTTYMVHHNVCVCVFFNQSEDKMATNLSLKPRNSIFWL